DQFIPILDFFSSPSYTLRPKSSTQSTERLQISSTHPQDADSIHGAHTHRPSVQKKSLRSKSFAQENSPHVCSARTFSTKIMPPSSLQAQTPLLEVRDINVHLSVMILII